MKDLICHLSEQTVPVREGNRDLGGSDKQPQKDGGDIHPLIYS